jgi:hypothetical protein
VTVPFTIEEALSGTTRFVYLVGHCRLDRHGLKWVYGFGTGPTKSNNPNPYGGLGPKDPYRQDTGTRNYGNKKPGARSLKRLRNQRYDFDG